MKYPLKNVLIFFTECQIIRCSQNVFVSIFFVKMTHFATKQNKFSESPDSYINEKSVWQMNKNFPKNSPRKNAISFGQDPERHDLEIKMKKKKISCYKLYSMMNEDVLYSIYIERYACLPLHMRCVSCFFTVYISLITGLDIK